MSTRTVSQAPSYVDDSEYVRAHGSSPGRSQYGAWIFRVDGAEVERCGEYRRVRQDLVAGVSGATFHLLP